jgi:hypothetical protein
VVYFLTGITINYAATLKVLMPPHAPHEALPLATADFRAALYQVLKSENLARCPLTMVSAINPRPCPPPPPFTSPPPIHVLKPETLTVILKVALVRLGPSWFGLLCPFTEGKRTNLMLSVLDHGVRCALFDRNLHSRMPLGFMPLLRLKRAGV